ncbi:MAG: hypothetical protein WCF78_01200 [archaeon]
MGFATFFKKIIQKDKVNEPKSNTRELTFDEIKNIVENKEKEIKSKEKEIFLLIKDRASIFANELKHKVRDLEGIDLKSKDTHERVKLIVKTNLNIYIDHVRGLIESISNLNENNFENNIKLINHIFMDFEKKSFISYQRSVFLIGDDLIETRKSIADFSKYLINMLEKNKEIIGYSRIINSITKKVDQVSEANETISKFEDIIKQLTKKIKVLEEQNITNIELIENIKKNKSYNENSKILEQVKLNETELNQEIYELKRIIDFKGLGNIFHTDEKKTKIISAYKDKFEDTYLKDNGTSILSLLDEAKLNNLTIISKIKQINEKQEELIKIKATIKKDETEDLLADIQNTKTEIENINNEVINEFKKLEKIKIQRENLIDSIKLELARINVKI